MSESTLTSDQVQLLAGLLDAWRTLRKDEQTSFGLVRYDGDRDRPLLMLPGSSFQQPVFLGDIEALAAEQLLTLAYGSRGLSGFRLTNEAFRVYSDLQAHGRGLAAVVETAVRNLLPSQSFAARFPQVRLQLGLAEEALSSADADSQLTNMGHYCREALQAFATGMIEQFPPSKPEPDKARTLNRLTGVLEAVRPRLGDREYRLLGTLLEYAHAVNGVVQRQIHDTTAASELLTWEDGRRAVFHTFLLIYEFDRSLGPFYH